MNTELYIEDAGNVKPRSAYRDSMYAVIKNQDKSGLFSVKGMTKLFYTAFAIGYHFNKKEQIAKGAINHVNLVSFDRNIKELMVLLILKRKPDIESPKELWKEVSEYAEYGIQVLFDSWKTNNIIDVDNILKMPIN